MVLKLAILIVVVLYLCFYGQEGMASLDYQFETCKRIKNTKSRYIGYIPKNNKVGSEGGKAYVACDDYYVLHGEKYSVCQADGTWQPPLGGCQLNPEYNKTYCKPYVSANSPLFEYNPPSEPIPLNFTVTMTCPDVQHLENSMYKYMEDIWKQILEECIDEENVEKMKKRRRRRKEKVNKENVDEFKSSINFN